MEISTEKYIIRVLLVLWIVCRLTILKRAYAYLVCFFLGSTVKNFYEILLDDDSFSWKSVVFL
jgi:hypothetical protein